MHFFYIEPDLAYNIMELIEYFLLYFSGLNSFDEFPIN
jgi:hypothetical protein